MKKKKVDALLKSFNKQKMAKLTESRGKSLDYACAVVGGAVADKLNMNIPTVRPKCATQDKRECDESVKICV